jgi:hypothetical protein
MVVRFLLLALCLTACGAGQPETLTNAGDGGPAFDPLAFFQGHTQSWGVIESRSGAPTEQVVTDSHGETDANGRLRMVQHLSFADGTTQERDWVMWRSGPDRFDATANDMVGQAQGASSGRMFHWQWVMARRPGNSLMNVTIEQWMYRMSDGSVTIRTTISKFGVIVAEVTEQFSHAENS